MLLTSLDSILPRGGNAIDLAGGAGRHAVWLARRGLNVLLADISDEAITTAGQLAVEADVSLSTSQIDLEQEPFPPGPWDVILSVHFLFRPLFSLFPQMLADGGMLVCIQPTQSNLERHAKPSKRFLLEDGELPTLVRDLEIIHYQEGWLDEGRHEAVLGARKSV